MSDLPSREEVAEWAEVVDCSAMPQYVIARLYAEGRLVDREAINIEAVAAVEHDQWVHWTVYMLENNTEENAERWRRQITTPYAELTEAEKESDREWAHKALDAALGEV